MLITRLFTVALSIVICSCSHQPHEPHEPTKNELDVERCESQSWTVQLHRYGMQVVCEILTSDQMNQNEESIAEISQALDTSTEEEEPSDEEEDDDSMVFSLYPLHELYALALEKMDESRSIVSGQIVCTFTGLSTEQLLLVIVQPFLFWFRFPSHFWFMTNVPKYFRKNHIIVRVSLQDVENYVSKFALYHEYSKELLHELNELDTCVGDQLHRFSLIGDHENIRNLHPQVLDHYLKGNKKFLQDRLCESCEVRLTQGLIQLLKELNAEVYTEPIHKNESHKDQDGNDQSGNGQSQKADEESQKADEESQKANEESQKADEESQKADEESQN